MQAKVFTNDACQSGFCYRLLRFLYARSRYWGLRRHARSTCLNRACGNVPVVAERLGHLVEAERYNENGEQENDSEHGTPGVKGTKEKTQQESHRNHLPRYWDRMAATRLFPTPPFPCNDM